MGNRPKIPGAAANGVDLADVLAQGKARKQLEALAAEWDAKIPAAAAANLSPAILILTARFEVVVAVLADALGLPGNEVMVQVETAALSKAIGQLDAILATVTGDGPSQGDAT